MLVSFPSRIRAALGACLFALPMIASAHPHPGTCLEVLSPSVDFGEVWIGQERLGFLQIRNACQGTLTISKISVSKPVFRAATPVPLSVPGFASVWLDFRLTAKSQGTVTGTACLQAKPGGGPVCVPLSGYGVVPPTMTVSPTSLQVTQAAGTKGAASLQIANSGGDRLEAIVDFTGPAIPRPDAGWKVAFVHTPTLAGYGQFMDMVRSLSNVDTLDVFDATAALPTLAYLNRFDVVMVETGSGADWADVAAIGDTLGAYLQAGGKVLAYAQALSNGSGALGGLIHNFAPIHNHDMAFPGHSGTLTDHPINAGVTTFWAASAMTVNSLSDAAVVPLGTYDLYGYLTGAVHTMYPIAVLNFHPGDQNWSGDVPILVANALDYLGTKAEWMTTSGLYPGFDILTVAGGATRTLDMNVLTHRMAPGTYQGEIQLLHSDPSKPTPYIVPVTLTVTP